MTEQTSTPITLYVWPGKWGLPSFDPGCLATVLYLQLTVPGKFSISECNNPDISPSGQLPFMVHDQLAISSFASIVKYISGLERSGQNDLDSPLSASERSQKTAWASHIEAHFGNLVYHTFYCSPANWEKVVHPALVSMYSAPQRYYVPQRIRTSYRPRLEGAGLWPELESGKEAHPKDKGNAKVDDGKREAKQKFIQAFEREKIQEKAKDIIGIYARLLEGKQFVYKERATTLDLMLAAHTLLLVVPPFPDTLIKELAVEWYTTLADHAKRIRDMAFGGEQPTYQVHSSQSSFWDLLPSRRTAATKSPDRTPEDLEYEKLTWGFFGLAVGSIFAYFAIVGTPIRIEMRSRDEQVEGEEDEDEVGEGNGEEGEGEKKDTDKGTVALDALSEAR